MALSRASNDDIVKMYAEEMLSVIGIADRTGLHKETVRRILLSMKVEMRRPGRRSASVTPEKTAEVVSMYTEERIPIYIISEKTGMTLYGVRALLIRNNIKIRRGRAAQ